MEYLTNCINSTAAKINAMVEDGREIKYRTARQSIGSNNLDEWAKDMSYDTGFDRCGLRLKNDYCVVYYRGRYENQPCIYIVHSAIEYIFV